MAKPGVVLIQKFKYRDLDEEFSNRYHFTETAPGSPEDWRTLIDDVAAQVKTVFTSSVKIVRAYGYTDTDNDSVFSVDYTAETAEIAGTLDIGVGHNCPGDAAMWVRWLTPDLNSNGRKIYLRKYYHGVLNDENDSHIDKVVPTQVAALVAMGTALADGTVDGFTLCGPDGATAGDVAASTYVTTRTLKRRGRRPNP